MSTHTCPFHRPQGRPLCGQDFRTLRLLIKANGREKYSARRFAHELKISESKLELIEIGRRKITAPDINAYKKVEQNFIFVLKEIGTENQQTVSWLVDALIRHAGLLKPRDRTRLKKCLDSVIA